MQINDKVVAITGAARGIGKATALRFGQAGARVASHGPWSTPTQITGPKDPAPFRRIGSAAGNRSASNSLLKYRYHVLPYKTSTRRTN